MIESMMIYVCVGGGHGVIRKEKTTMTNKELASKHQMEGSIMHMRRMVDGYMHRRMQKNKHMQGEWI